MLKVLFVLLPLALPSICAYYPDTSQLCVYACQASFSAVTFGTQIESDDYYQRFCQDTLLFQSTYLCSHQRCSRQQIDDGLDYLQSECHHANIIIPTFDSVIANFSEEAVKAIPIITHDDVFEDAVNNTLLPTTKLYELAYRTWVSMNSRHE